MNRSFWDKDAKSFGRSNICGNGWIPERFLRCDRYAVLSSSKLPIKDKIKRRAQAENSAALRRSLRAQTAMAQTANVPKVSMIDLTKQKKKRKRRKSKHKPEAMDNLSDIEHEQDMEEIRSQVLLSQRAAAQRDLDQITFKIVKSNNYKVGNNIITNRLHSLNNLIPLMNLNDSLSSFKIKCKKSLL